MKSFFLDGKLPFNRKWVTNFALYVYPLGLTIFLAGCFYTGKSIDVTKDLGEITLNMLMFLLLIGPLAKVFPDFGILRTLASFRKEIGLMMFYSALAHGLSYVPFGFKLWTTLPDFEFPLYIKFGLAALLTCSILYVTSNKFSMKLLGKNWLLVHKLVYLVLILALLHVYFMDEDESGKVLLCIGLVIVLKLMSWKKVQIRLFNRK